MANIWEKVILILVDNLNSGLSYLIIAVFNLENFLFRKLSRRNNGFNFFQGTKVKVEVKIEEDGTHNPDRLLFHIRTNLPIDKGEPEALESYDYLNDMSNRQIDDFDDVNEGEKGMENICYLIEGA